MSDWEELGIEPAATEKTVRAYKLITELYSLYMGGAGGCGHIVFDDWNVGDSSIDFCLKGCDNAKAIGDLGPEVCEMSRAALLYFRCLTEQERYTALAFHWKELDIFDYIECL